jgi:ankyrin repeat protein
MPAKKPHPQLRAMIDAHDAGDVAAVRQLLTDHPDLEQTGLHDNHITWLNYAADKGQLNVVEFWLDRGWDPNRMAPHNDPADGLFTALHMARGVAMTRLLLSRGANVNACQRELGTPLHYAVIRNDLEQIRVLLDAGADPALMNGEDNGYTALAYAIYLNRPPTGLNRDAAIALLRAAGAPEQGRSLFPKRIKAKSLDLRKEFEAVYKYLAKRVSKFNPKKHDGLGGPGTVQAIHVGFDHIHTGWVAVVFDTRNDARPDGEWTTHIDGNVLKLARWQQATEYNSDQPLTLIQLDGSRTELPANFELAVPLGEMLKAVLLKARDDGLFAELAKAPACQFGVEHLDGEFGWPAYEDRGHENLA